MDKWTGKRQEAVERCKGAKVGRWEGGRGGGTTVLRLEVRKIVCEIDMARCIPDRLHPSQAERSESDFLQRLRHELPDDFIIIPCLEIPRQNGIFDSETDFVILHPRGRLILEVKGGTILCERGRWKRVRQGRAEEITPPFFQARDNAYEIRDYLVKVFGKEAPEARMMFNQAVVFPDVDFMEDTIEITDDRLVDRGELTRVGLTDIVNRLLNDGEKRYLQRFPDKPLPTPLSVGQLEKIAHKLRPELRLTANLSSEEVDLELIRLSASQLHVLEMLEQNKRLRVTGGPGSGKTLMAVETCRRELELNPTAKIGLICFNRFLGAFLADVVVREKMTQIQAGSFYSHCDGLIGNRGKVNESDSSYFVQRVREALQVAKKLPPDEKYDLGVVDEGQDFRYDGEMLELMDVLLKGGLARGRWRWFEDLDQVLSPEPTDQPTQKHEALLDLLDVAASARLENNWRNTEQIAQAVGKVMGLPVKPTARIFGPQVSTAPLVKDKEFAMLEALLSKVVLKDYQPKDIVILSMHGAGRESYAGKDTLAGLRVVSYDPSRAYEEGTIRVSTVFKFKGMESHAVILTDIDSLGSVRDRRKAYVGMSRAKYALYLIAKEGLNWGRGEG